MPHVPLRTQPTASDTDRTSYEPLLGLNGDARYVRAPGIASVEFVFDPTKEQSTWLSFGDGTRGSEMVKARRAMIAEAEEWERSVRAKHKSKTRRRDTEGAASLAV